MPERQSSDVNFPTGHYNVSSKHLLSQCSAQFRRSVSTMCRGIMEHVNVGRFWVTEYEIDMNENRTRLANLKIYRTVFGRRSILIMMGL
jgi:hypothetical protein